eukprot:1185784-Prorocentrum_minimum.AAC.2
MPGEVERSNSSSKTGKLANWQATASFPLVHFKPFFFKFFKPKFACWNLQLRNSKKIISENVLSSGTRVSCAHTMRLPVQCDCGECNEWAILEFQGEIELQSPDMPLNNLEVGTLCQITPVCPQHSIRSPTLGVGTLKPVALLRSRFATSEEQATAMQTSADGDETKVCEGFDIIGIVRRKYMFKHRPKALISKPEATKKMRTSANFFNKG